jgi:hypothetical protein
LACKAELVRFITPAEAKALPPCTKCGGGVKRTPRPPTAFVKERLDNGIMPRAVERPADAERLYHERARKDPLKD